MRRSVRQTANVALGRTRYPNRETLCFRSCCTRKTAGVESLPNFFVPPLPRRPLAARICGSPDLLALSQRRGASASLEICVRVFER